MENVPTVSDRDKTASLSKLKCNGENGDNEKLINWQQNFSYLPHQDYLHRQSQGIFSTMQVHLILDIHCRTSKYNMAYRNDNSLSFGGANAACAYHLSLLVA